MCDNDEFPELSNFIKNYFGEDCDLWGQTVEDMILLYMNENEAPSQMQLLRDIDEFSRINHDNLDYSFKEIYGLFFNPVPWGHTTASFFYELKKFLKE
jgi:hypothetical protein